MQIFRHAWVSRGYFAFLLLAGLCVPFFAADTLMNSFHLRILSLTAFAVVLDLLPVYLPGGIVWSTTVICYILTLHKFGFEATAVPLLVGQIIGFLHNYRWNLAKAKWHRLFVTYGMYFIAIAVSRCLELLLTHNFPRFLVLAGMVTCFEVVNYLFLYVLQRSMGMPASIPSRVKTYNLLPFLASIGVLIMIDTSSSFYISLLYACGLLVCFILLSKAYYEANRAFQYSHSKYELITKHTDELILVVDTNQMITYASPSYDRLFRLAPNQLVQTGIEDLLEGTPKLSQVISQVISKPSIRTVEHFFEIQGVSIFAETSVYPVLLEDKGLREIIIVSRDISERMRQQEYMIQAEKLAIAGQLAAGVAHEIRNPLTSVKGFLQLLRPQFDQFSSEAFDVVWTEIGRIDEITSELLVLAKPQSTEFALYDISAAVQHTVTLLEGQAHANNVFFEMFLEGQVFARCNMNQLRQVFLNLFKNSIEAMDKGGLIAVYVTPKEGGAMIVIEDSGPGIPEQFLKNIGEPFYTTKEKGTGLGLMVVHKIINEHGGKITLESNQGEGTRFSIWLPTHTKKENLSQNSGSVVAL